MPSAATRQIYWHIEHVWVMYLLLIPTFATLAYGLYKRYQFWRMGQPAERTKDVGARLRRVAKYILAHKKFMRQPVAGWMHALLFYTMLFLFVGTVVVAIEADLRIPIMHGWFYLIFQSLILDIVGAFGLVALGIALMRRYVAKVPRLQHNRAGVKSDPSDSITIAALFLMYLQGFLLEAVRMAGNPTQWDAWSPVGQLLSRPMAGMSGSLLVLIYQIFWWFHLATVFSWIAYLPYSKMIHIFTSTASVYFGDLRPAGVGVLESIDFDTAERFGKSVITDFTWKDLLDLDACTSCGRCQDACPAYAAGQPLSPKNLILDLRDYMHEHMPKLVDGSATVDHLPPLVGGAIKEETLWACTTCRACMEECPVSIEHVPKILSMRQHLTMEQGAVPSQAAEALKSMEDREHPFKGSSASRLDWCEGLDVAVAADVGEVEVLYWVGCAATFDPRAQRVARAFVQLLQAAKVNFAIMGKEERCTGDPARRMGNEFLYEQIARQNIDLLQQYKPKKIVATCPHCFNVIGQEYRALGGEFDTVHHTQMLKELVDSGHLKVNAGKHASATFHDPCYLGRWNEEYDAPRALLDKAVAEQREMEHHASGSLCCGAGGGHAWMEEEGHGPRINQIRAQEAVATGAEVVAVGCPFCMTMMEDGVKTTAGDRAPEVLDIAELLLQALEETEPAHLAATAGDD